VKAAGPARLMRIFAGVMSGAHGAFPEVILARSPWLRIEGAGPDGELPVAYDGDLTAGRTPLAIRCRPAALRVMAPATAHTTETTDTTLNEEAQRAA
jgi:diacylglycerol kinase family enzyme